MEPKGIKIIEELKNKTKIPYIGIGGINNTNIKPIIQNGAQGIAIISAISESDNPEITTKDIYQKLQEAWDQNEEK